MEHRYCIITNLNLLPLIPLVAWIKFCPANALPDDAMASGKKFHDIDFSQSSIFDFPILYTFGLCAIQLHLGVAVRHDRVVVTIFE